MSLKFCLNYSKCGVEFNSASLNEGFCSIQCEWEWNTARQKSDARKEEQRRENEENKTANEFNTKWNKDNFNPHDFDDLFKQFEGIYGHYRNTNSNNAYQKHFQQGHTESTERVFQKKETKITIDCDLFLQIVSLCHPDRHQEVNKERANKVTQKLLTLRKEIK